MPNDKRKRVVVEEVEVPASPEVVSSKELSEEPKTDILTEGIKTETPAVPEAIGKEIHQEEKRLHDIHTEGAPVPTVQNKSGNPVFWILIPGIFLLGALLGGIVFYQRGVNREVSSTPSPTLSPSQPSASPLVTPAAQVDLSKYSISILNGSGIAGEAGKVKSLLVEAGFKVSGTGNASSYGFTKTVVKAKSTVDTSFLSKLTETLGKSYMLDANQTLSSSSADDIQVVVGTSKAE